MISFDGKERRGWVLQWNTDRQRNGVSAVKSVALGFGICWRWKRSFDNRSGCLEDLISETPVRSSVSCA
jgi:hypothetical protein